MLRDKEVSTVIVVSDLHIGCQLGLCPPEGLLKDEGGRYLPSPLQLKVWGYWDDFWNRWVPMVTKGEPFALVVNGDAIDGRHHKSTTQISQNITDQVKWGREILWDVVRKASAYYHIRGTEAHVGPSGENEEQLAMLLGAIPGPGGRYARFELWKKLGPGVIHCLHHIGTTGSQAYESTAVMKELVESYVEAGRWGDTPPDVIVRSHRHRHLQLTIPSRNGQALAIVTPAWQLKTPFTWRIPGARQSQPQFGGIAIRTGDEDKLYARHYVKRIDRDEVE